MTQTGGGNEEEKWVHYGSAAAVVRDRVKELRERRGWSAAKLAELCAENEMPNLNRDVIANLESGRRPNVTIDEVLVLALVLDVAPVNLFIPVVNHDFSPIPVVAMNMSTPRVSTSSVAARSCTSLILFGSTDSAAAHSTAAFTAVCSR